MTLKPPRTRRTAGGSILPRSDGRILPARRVKSLTIEFEQAIGAEVTALQRAKIAAAVSLALVQENLRDDLAKGASVDPAQMLAVAEGLERIFADLAPASA